MARRPPSRVEGARELVGGENQRPDLSPAGVAQQCGGESLLTDYEGPLLVS